MIYLLGAVAVVWCVVRLLLAIFRWDWLSQHPRLYLDLLGRWTGAEYDSNIRKKTIIKFSVWVAAVCIGVVVITVTTVNNYRDVQKLADCIQVNAGETLPLAGGELSFRYRVEDNKIVIVRNNAGAGLFGNYTVKADTHDYGEALVAFTGVFTNTTDQTLIVSNEDIKVFGIPTDTAQGYKFKGSWVADHKTDGDGNMVLAPGEDAFLYFWAVLNKDRQTQPYAYVVQDGEHFYRLDMDSLETAVAGELTAQNTYMAVRETMDDAKELAYDVTYHGENIGDVTLVDTNLLGSAMAAWNAYLKGEDDSSSEEPLYIELVMEVESPNKLWDSTLEQWMSILVMTEDDICWEGAEYDIKERKDPVNEGENYSCEVHYTVQVPGDADRLQIVLSMGGDNYTGVLILEE